jgi:dethiobiotin synthetase
MRSVLVPDTKGFFVTGTDTGVGKTVLSALLCFSLKAFYWKPIQTGAREGTDRQQLLAWGLPAQEAVDEIYLFDEPVSPHLAAQWAKVQIRLERIPVPPFNTKPCIVEGAGGALVPINDSKFMTDLAQHIRLPVVVAARSTLGTINHTLMTLLALRTAKLPVRGVIMIGPINNDNQAAVERYGNSPVIGKIPPLPTIDRDGLERTFQQYFDPQAFCP